MLFSHDTEHALTTVADLVNTSPEATGGELLAGLEELNAFVERNQISGAGNLSQRDLSAIRRLRSRLHKVFATGGDQRAAVDLVNAIVADVRTVPHLTDHDGYQWHVHYFASGARLPEHLAADCGMALAFVIAAGELDRLRVCEAPACSRVLVDLSRNRCRRYCDSRTCGNRMHVAAYRARQRAAAG